MCLAGDPGLHRSLPGNNLTPSGWIKGACAGTSSSVAPATPGCGSGGAELAKEVKEKSLPGLCSYWFLSRIPRLAQDSI